VICLGYHDTEKADLVRKYRREHEIDKVVILSPEMFGWLDVQDADKIEYDQIIKYKVFYRLLQEINSRTLIVVNECLRTQNRHDLTYNCIRHYLNQTQHQIVFQYLPIIESLDDFMILVDFETQSRWKREKLSPEILRECWIDVRDVSPVFQNITVETTKAERAAYQKEKRKLIDNIGLRDPHTIPRNLYLVTGKPKLRAVDPAGKYLGRNARLKLPNLVTYREPLYEGEHIVFEFCHNHIEFADFLTLSRQRDLSVLVATEKVDRWYFERYLAWAERIRDAYATISGK
jgi:hypothetical protein